MRKNINKIIAIAIGISVMSANSLPVFASETGQATASVSTSSQSVQKNILTVQQAVDAAIANSDKLKLKTKEIQKYRDEIKVQRKINDAKKDVAGDLDNDAKKVIDFPYDKLNITADQTEQEQNFMKDQIKNDITSQYNDIVLTEVSIDKAKKNIEIQTTKLNDLKLKNQLGLTIDTDVTSTQLQIQTLKDTVTAKENTLKDKKDYFQVLTNLNLDNYSFDHSLDYKTFRIDGTIDKYVSDKLDEYFKYNEKLFNASKDYAGNVKSASDYDADVDDQIHDFKEPTEPKQSNYAVTTSDAVTGVQTTTYPGYEDAIIQYNKDIQSYQGDLSNYNSYLDLKYSVDSSRVTIDESKKTLTNAIKGLYSQLVDLENQIAQVQENIKLTNKQLEFAKLQYDLGLTTKSDYDNTVLKAQDLDTNLRTLINNYNILKDKIQEPWLVASSSN